jgi:hypothetical protein
MSELNDEVPEIFTESKTIKPKEYHKSSEDTAFSTIKEGKYMDWQKEFMMCHK